MQVSAPFKRRSFPILLVCGAASLFLSGVVLLPLVVGGDFSFSPCCVVLLLSLLLLGRCVPALPFWEVVHSSPLRVGGVPFQTFLVMVLPSPLPLWCCLLLLLWEVLPFAFLVNKMNEANVTVFQKLKWME